MLHPQNFKPIKTDGFRNTVYDKSRLEPEKLFWNSFKRKHQFQSHSAITFIDFSHNQPDKFLANTGTVVKIFDTETGDLLKNLTKFKTKTYSAKFRVDGNLIVAGEDRGRVRILDTTNGTLLRDFKNHKATVRTCSWLTDTVKCVSASDDLRAIVWDISQGELLQDVQAHEDSIRCVISFKKGFITSSYDGKAKYFDLLQKSPAVVFNNSKPINCTLAFRNCLLTSSKSAVKVWDLRKPDHYLKKFKDLHQKSITQMCSDVSNTRLLSSSLDGSIAVHRFNDTFSSCKTTYRIHYTESALSVGLNLNNTVFVTGLTDGTIHYRKKTLKKKRKLVDLNQVTVSKKPPAEEQLTESQSRILQGAKLRQYDKALKEFRYKSALSIALGCKKAYVAVAVFAELDQRGGLEAALVGRDNKELTQLLTFLLQFLTNPKFSKVLVPIFALVAQLYKNNPYFLSRLSEFEVLFKKEAQAQNEVMNTYLSADMMLKYYN